MCGFMPPHTPPPVRMSAPLFYTDRIPLSSHDVLLLTYFIFGALGFFLTYFLLSSLISNILISLLIMKPEEQSSLVGLLYFSIHLKGMNLFLYLALSACLYGTEEQLGAFCLLLHLRLWADSFMIAFFSQGCG